MTTATLTATDQIAQYAAVVWRPGELIEVRAIPADRESGAAVSFWTKAEDLSAKYERMEALNHRQAGIYAGILPRAKEGGKTDADCAGGFAVWADFDGVEPRDAWKTATGAGLPAPSMALCSGHGAHLFWALTERTDSAAISGLVADLAALLGSDSTVKNPSRILRLPGFVNWKAPVADAVLMFANPARRYAFDALRAAVPVPKRQENPPRAPDAPEGAVNGVPVGLPEAAAHLLARVTAYVKEIPGAAEGGRNAEAYRVAALLRNDFKPLSDADAWALLCQWNQRNAPPLDERELRAVFQSAGRHAKHAPGEKANAPRTVGGGCATPEPARVGSATAPLLVIPAAPADDDQADMRADVAAQSDGSLRTIPLPWKRLSDLSAALRPGTVCILAGPPGTGKSFFAASIALAVHAAEVPWKYLPLEDRRTDFKWRLLAILAGDYRMIEVDAEGAAWRQENLERFAWALHDLTPHVCENPRVGCKDANGKTVVPPLPFGAVLDWIGAACGQAARVLFVDPISQIDFDGREPWKAEAEFIRKALALTADAGATLVLVAHTVKRGGKTAALPLTLEDVQGSAMIARLCHTALILDAHDRKTSSVYRPAGLREDVEHNRTVLVAKARHASGARQRVAFTQRSDAPAFEEHGIIAPRGAGETESSEHWSDRT